MDSVSPGSHGARRGGSCCAGLALCKPGPVRAGAASRQPPSGSREPAGPGARGRSTSMSTCLRSPGRRGRALHVRLWCASGPGPLRIRSWTPLRLGPGPRARHLTREHVCQRYVLAGYPAISRIGGRRGASPGVVAVPVRLPLGGSPGSGWSSDCDGGDRSDSRPGRGVRAGSDRGGGAAVGPDQGRPTRFGPGAVPAGRREPGRSRLRPARNGRLPGPGGANRGGTRVTDCPTTLASRPGSANRGEGGITTSRTTSSTTADSPRGGSGDAREDGGEHH